MMGLSILEQQRAGSGLVHLYVGSGKGKTTAAVGLAVRFLGCDGKVLFCQFLKGRATGEIAMLEKLGAGVLRAKAGGKFVFQMDDAERSELRRSHGGCLARAAEIAAEGAVGLLVLDEVVDAVNAGAVELSAVLALLESRAPGVEVVLTGRNPPPELLEAADYHTEFLARRHPYEKGTEARRGIEY